MLRQPRILLCWSSSEFCLGTALFFLCSLSRDEMISATSIAIGVRFLNVFLLTHTQLPVVHLHIISPELITLNLPCLQTGFPVVSISVSPICHLFQIRSSVSPLNPLSLLALSIQSALSSSIAAFWIFLQPVHFCPFPSPLTECGPASSLTCISTLAS